MKATRRSPSSVMRNGAYKGQRGSALVAALILGLAVAGGAAALGEATHELAAELRVRREALCARYAALGGLALGASPADQAATLGGGVDSLTVHTLLRAAGWCVTRSTARCGAAQRTIERTVSPAACAA